VPVRDPNTGETSRVDHLAFVTQQSVGAIGVGLGCLHQNTSSVGSSGGFVRAIPLAPKNQAILASITLLTAAVHTEFDAELAATMSGLGSPDPRNAVLIGAGAIGSNISEMLVREGRFDWTIVGDRSSETRIRSQRGQSLSDRRKRSSRRSNYEDPGLRRRTAPHW
jgi:hypothetical protein